MGQPESQILEQTEVLSISANKKQATYEDILTSFGISFTSDDHYIRSGSVERSQGWIIHLSSIASRMEELLITIIPLLSNYKCEFKLPKTSTILSAMNSGHYGKYKIGKAFTIYLENQDELLPFAIEVINKTKDFQGPLVFTDFPLGNIVYSRYGSYKNRIETDNYGYKFRVVEGSNNSILLDRYYFPPVTPPGVENPFLPLAKEIIPKNKSKFFVLGSKYLPIKLLKSDSKGDVWKALYFNEFLYPKWAVIKQGREGLFLDDVGRDIRSRLSWQYEVNKKILGQVNTPAAIELLSDSKATFLITSYLKKCQPLIHVIYRKSERIYWGVQKISTKLELLDVFLNIVLIISKLHSLGFIHRDITGTNFLIDKNNRAYTIDLELCYSVADHTPNPAFGLGTNGYMSHEQINSERPTYKEDIYALGALLTTIIAAGIEPVSIIDENTKLTEERLTFLVNDDSISSLILSCISIDPNIRPGLDQIYSEIKNFRKRISSNIEVQNLSKISGQPELNEIINKTIIALGSDLMSSNNLWYTRIENEYGIEVYPLFNKSFFFSIYEGISGVVWTLCKMKAAGYNIEPCTNNLIKSFDYFDEEVYPKLNEIETSLYYGKAGIAIMITECVKAGIILFDSRINHLVLSSLLVKSNTYNIMTGISGQILAIWHCLEVVKNDHLTTHLIHLIDAIMENQEKDGSWITQDNQQLDKKIKKTGFGHGIAGIVYTLLESYQRLQNEQYLLSAKKGLKYLSRMKRSKRDAIIWANNNYTKEAGSWWCHGSPGIALTFLKAYEILNDKKYLRIAERALKLHHQYILTPKLSICHGISGLGEIYLEAFKVTNNPAWLERAHWVKTVILSLRRETSNEENYWLVDKNDFPVANLMLGNSGVLHFLARLENPTLFKFPLLP